jgi:hypothetical protein
MAGFFMRGRMAGMNRKRALIATLVLGNAALVIAVYFAVYFGISKKVVGVTQFREFNKPWQAKLFVPAAIVESLFVGEQINTDCRAFSVDELSEQ